MVSMATRRRLVESGEDVSRPEFGPVRQAQVRGRAVGRGEAKGGVGMGKEQNEVTENDARRRSVL